VSLTNPKLVSDCMTPCPHGIDPGESLAVARKRMAEHRIRHLPVRTGGKVVGIITERDLFVLATFDVDFNKGHVGPAMSPDPYTVPPTAELAIVAAQMAERRIGSALVVDAAGHLLGIFTDTDALKALARLAGGNP